ncbi:OprO/OprP family phosphate-selective porin [Pseudotamlana agarivorans]|uniref:OprO/OprP family phosphate-selective porin n=1 Tax=Pseudotamlana agarivorans TaxID=481183 RepID=UPI001FE0534A|nr:porin [Tamlana agarivorans]
MNLRYTKKLMQIRIPVFHLGTPIKFILLFIIIFNNAYSQEVNKDSISLKKIEIDYTNKGFQFKTTDNKHLLHIESRLQFRFATPGDQNPLDYDDIFPTNNAVYKINRARLKIGGHAFQPYLKYYFEYELSQSNLLDFRIMFEKWKGFNIKIGQWKTYYNRERVISSGKQQMVDRSIINRPFTLDRQQGISFYGRLFEETPADITYHLSLLTGTGRGSTENDDNKMMYVGRFQWNLLGREVSMSGSDLENLQKPEALIAFAAATNTSPYTRFSQAGGGQLEGFAEGVAGQYKVNQFMIESAFKYKGFSWQSELHRKTIFDNINHTETHLSGLYVQAGYFFSNVFDFIPKPLEVAGRFANYNPNTEIPKDLEQEFGLAINWFFNGHRNKLTSEITYFQIDDNSLLDPADGFRFRIQWDISF